MSKLEVNAVEPQCGTNLTLGASGDTIIIPSGATISNQGTAAGFGPTGAVSWNTTKVTTGFTATSGVGYFCDTTSAAFTVTLPATPAAGAVVGIADYANTFATNNLTIGRNGSNIGGIATNSILSTNGLSVTFVYVDATQGWIVTDSGNRSDLPTAQFVTATGGTILTCGDFKIHTFTGPGTFTVSCAGNAQGSNSVDYLVVAGGGGGGFHVGGGGGAGGVRSNYPSPSIAGLPVTAQGYPITVGAGAAAASGAPTPGSNGNNSVFSTITSNGGGAGGPASTPVGGGGGGSSGGSGGGGGHGPSGGIGGAGNTPPTSPSQGNNGGNGTAASPGYTGGGGGGANAVGVNGGNTPTKGGNGGVGLQVNIDGNNYYWGGGGGGGTAGTTASLPIVGGNGGLGGGGGSAASTGPLNPSPSSFGTGGGSAINSGANGTNTGGPGSGGAGGAGGANSGGGGGAGAEANNPGGAGGSGIVIIRYKFQ
jgi:hypothetical protein